MACSTAALLPLGIAFLNPIPASAQSTIIINGGGYYPHGNYHRRNQPQSAPYIYGSPIPSPIPVNPATGMTPRRSDRYFDRYPDSAPSRDQNITIINVDRSYDRYPHDRYPNEVGYPRVRAVEVIPAPPIPNGLDPYR
ncbi:hypothetical protein [Chroococcidiopsis sp. SAG 2025]|uniref:hypothetical protein n=1 Tax=Chroococcidiopsis sp. SAG 2025 TaxID=171389 RepID=UPI00293718C7|nr:hypothetical protein [Chroococcidiopsis sp. SAG 2025]